MKTTSLIKKIKMKQAICDAAHELVMGSHKDVPAEVIYKRFYEEIDRILKIKFNK